MDFNTHRENYNILHFMFCITSSPYHCRTDNNILLLLLIFLLIFLLVFFIAFLAFPILVPSLFWFISIMIFLLIVFLAFTILVPSLFWFVYFKWFSVSFSVSKLSINIPPFSNSLIMLWLLLVLSLYYYCFDYYHYYYSGILGICNHSCHFLWHDNIYY